MEAGTLAPGDRVEGLDGVVVGATEGSLDVSIEIAMVRTEPEEVTDAPLDVDVAGPAYRVSSDARAVTKPTAAADPYGRPFVVGLPVPEGVAVDDLAIAMLLPGEEAHVETREHADPPFASERTPHADIAQGEDLDEWTFRRAFHDDERDLLWTITHSLTEEGRVFAVVRDASFETRESGRPRTASGLPEPPSPPFEARCHPTDFDHVSYGCGDVDRDAAAALLENAYEDYTSLGYTDAPALYRVPVDVGLHEDEPWAELGAYVITLRACSEAAKDFGNGAHGKYFGTDGPGDAWACYGPNVNWKKTPDPPPALWVEDTIRHEVFHAFQAAYLDGLGSNWVTEGTARAAQESLQQLRVARNGDSAAGPEARHDVDVALNASNQKYPAQDFWIWLGKRLNQGRAPDQHEGLEYLIPYLEEGADTDAVDTVVRKTSAYGGAGFAGLSAAYLDWVRNQAFEKEIGLGNGTLGAECAYDGTHVQNLETLAYAPDEAAPATRTLSVGPLQSRVVRFDLAPFPRAPYEATLRAAANDSAVKIKFYDADDAGSTACRTTSGTSGTGTRLVQHEAGDGSHRFHALVSNTDLSHSHDVDVGIDTGRPHLQIRRPVDGFTFQEGDTELIEAVATGFDDYGADFEVEWSYEDDEGAKQVFATTEHGAARSVTLPCTDGPITAEASNGSASATDLVDVNCTPAEERFTFLLDTANSGEVRSDGSVNTNPEDDANEAILVGDTEGGVAIRGYLDFDLSTLPSDLASIESAELTVFFDDVWGEPFSDLGSLVAIHDEYGSLDASDYPTSTPRPGRATLTNAADPFGNVTVDVTTAVRDAWANRSSHDTDVQFVLHFDIADSDDNADDLYEVAAFEEANGQVVMPTLDVTVEHF